MKRDTKDNKRLAFKQLLDSVDGAATATAILVGVSGALRCEMKEVALIMMIVWWNSKLRGQSRSIMIPSTVTDSSCSLAFTDILQFARVQTNCGGGDAYYTWLIIEAPKGIDDKYKLQCTRMVVFVYTFCNKSFVDQLNYSRAVNLITSPLMNNLRVLLMEI